MTTSKGTAAKSPVGLPERMDFAACEDLAAVLEKHRGTDLCLQAANVRFLGALAAELLLRAKAEWQGENAAFGVIEASSDFLQGLTLLGIPETALIQEVSE